MTQDIDLARDKALAEAVRHHGALFARALNEAEAAGLDVTFQFDAAVQAFSPAKCVRICKCSISRHTEL